MFNAMRKLGAAGTRPAMTMAAMLMVGGCVSGGQVQVHQTPTARPVLSQPPIKTTDGAIFSGQVAYRPLFEDRRARAVGDSVVITIAERLQASVQSSSSAGRTGNTSLSIPILNKIPLSNGLVGAQIGATSDSSFEGKGGSSNLNVFQGTITTTVVETLSNGNLVVSGEKQIGLNHNAEIIRFSGVVTPASIRQGNVVTSTEVADVRLEYFGRGYIDQAQAMPWLQRFFLSVMPF